MSQNHTPGPWVVLDEHPEGVIDRCIKSAGGMYVATVHDTCNESWDADARLIAAAPDLLAALVELSDAVTLRTLRGRDHVPSMRGEQEALQGARAAISKAKASSS